MTKTDLTVVISPALAEALGIADPEDGVDYFTLFGLPRQTPDAGVLDKALMERSKALRQWQSSSQYGPEVVLLLKTLHRAAKILKDGKRCSTYREELERAERGEEASAEEEFEGLVRAAMADGQLTQDLRKELNEFISASGLDHANAQKIVQRVRDELQTQRKQAAAAAAANAPKGVAEDEGWTFRIAEKGEEGFALMMQGLAQSGELGRMTPGQLLTEAQRYEVPADRAAKLIADARRIEFGSIVSIVADGRAINEAQARLLLGKAATYGLDHEQAYEIISEYTLSARDPDDAIKLALAETFDQEEISQIVDNSGIHRRRRSFFATLLSGVPDWARNLILLVIGLGVLAFAGMSLLERFDAPSARGSNSADTSPTPTSPPSEPAATETPATAGPATPPAANDEAVTLISLPDPSSGLLKFEPEQPGDPPAFEIGITEVTCDQFQQFLRATLEPAPPGWTAAGNPPGGVLRRPVTDISWDRAMAYCRWLAQRNNWPLDSVTLPSKAEFLRVARYRGIRGSATDANIWERTRLGEATAPAEAMVTRWDKWFVTGKGQVYDLLGNAAEWSREREGDLAPVLGGHFGLHEPGFQPLQPRLMSATQGYPTVGFRIVRPAQ